MQKKFLCVGFVIPKLARKAIYGVDENNFKQA